MNLQGSQGAKEPGKCSSLGYRAKQRNGASRLMTLRDLEQVTALLSSVYYLNERELLLLLFAGGLMIHNGFISCGRVLLSFTGSVGFGV